MNSQNSPGAHGGDTNQSLRHIHYRGEHTQQQQQQHQQHQQYESLSHEYAAAGRDYYPGFRTGHATSPTEDPHRPRQHRPRYPPGLAPRLPQHLQGPVRQFESDRSGQVSPHRSHPALTAPHGKQATGQQHHQRSPSPLENKQCGTPYTLRTPPPAPRALRRRRQDNPYDTPTRSGRTPRPTIAVEDYDEKTLQSPRDIPYTVSQLSVALQDVACSQQSGYVQHPQQTGYYSQGLSYEGPGYAHSAQQLLNNEQEQEHVVLGVLARALGATVAEVKDICNPNPRCDEIRQIRKDDGKTKMLEATARVKKVSS